VVSKDEIRNFYDSYRTGGYGRNTSIYEQEGRLLTVLSLVDFPEAGTVLDVGCGTGWLTKQYAKLTQCQVIGIDFSEQSIAIASDEAIKEGLSNIKFEVMDAEGLEFDSDSFDRIVCSEVLEHLLQPEKALNEMHRVLKPTGQIVVTTPNPWNWNSVYGSVVRRITKASREQIHDQPIAPLKLNKMVKNASMRIIKRKGTYYLPPLISLESNLGGLFIKVSRFIERHNLLPYIGLYQVCLLRRVSGSLKMR